MKLINLEASFPGYRVRMSQDHERGHERDPWNFEIPCARFKGAIYPHGGTRLQAMIKTRFLRHALEHLTALGATPWQVGDEEATVLFDLADFPKVADYLKAKRKRAASGRPFSRKAREIEGERRQSGGSDDKSKV